MPTIITHAIVGLSAAKVVEKSNTPKRFLFLSLVCPLIPDLDMIGYNLFYIPIGHTLGHRGFFHSPVFCAILALLISSLFFRQNKIFSKAWRWHVLFFFFLIASHGILDAMTDGGRGVAFLSPFSNERFFFPWRPIEVSPISVQAFLGSRGLRVIGGEQLWIFFAVFSVVMRTKFVKKKNLENQSCF